MIVILKSQSSGITSEILHSDTLFGLIINAVALLFGNDAVEKVVCAAKNKDFFLTSAFPYIETNKCKLFPKPRKMLELNADIQKRFKKIKWVDEEILNSILKNELNSELVKKSSGEVLTKSCSLSECLSGLQIVPHVRMNRYLGRVTEEEDMSSLFHREIYMRSLWFSIVGKNEILKYVNSAIKFLEDDSFSGGRSTGLGKFKVEFKEDESLTPNKDASRIINLSLYFPSYEELSYINWDKSSWELIRRQGVIFNETRKPFKKPILMFSEGSYFELNGVGNLSGVIEDVGYNGLEHPVYQNGIIFKWGGL